MCKEVEIYNGRKVNVPEFIIKAMEDFKPSKPIKLRNNPATLAYIINKCEVK